MNFLILDKKNCIIIIYIKYILQNVIKYYIRTCRNAPSYKRERNEFPKRSIHICDLAARLKIFSQRFTSEILAKRYFSKLATFARVFSICVHIKCSITPKSSFPAFQHACHSGKSVTHVNSDRSNLQNLILFIELRAPVTLQISPRRAIWILRAGNEFTLNVRWSLYDQKVQLKLQVMSYVTLSCDRIHALWIYLDSRENAIKCVPRLNENGTLTLRWVYNEFTMNLLGLWIKEVKVHELNCSK